MHAEDLIRELPKGLIKWYEFHEGSKALYVSAETEVCQSMQAALEESGLHVDVQDIFSLEEDESDRVDNSNKIYDYIVLAGALERSRNPKKALRTIRNMLKATGSLLLGTDNRLGIRYFCGDRDTFTGRNFDSIENYVRINPNDLEKLDGRAYARAELKQMLEEAGFIHHRFYVVLPELERPQVLYAEDYLPEEELEVRIFPQYHYPDTVFLEEERLYTTLIRNGLFHAMANAYLVECPLNGCYANVRQVTVSIERGRENAMITVIRRDGKVEKRPVYAEGSVKCDSLIENTLYLRQHGVKMIDADREGNAVVMPYIQGEALIYYFRRLLCADKILFLRELDRFWEVILHSSESVPYEDVNWEEFEPGWERRKADDPNKDKWRKIAFGTVTDKEDLGVILKRGYIDLVPLNCFYLDGEFVFYDQELYLKNLPAKVILYRTIQMIYHGNSECEAQISQKELNERYHLSAYQDLWNKFTWRFLDDLRNDKKLTCYNKMRRRDPMVIHSNRQRMNYSAEEYERLFRDIFRGLEGRKLYLFGSGNFTKVFLSRFGAEYEVSGILDNDSNKWNQELEGIPIYAPSYLQTLSETSYKVIVCIKNYVPVIKQLEEIGARNFGIFDSNMNYPRKVMPITGEVVGEKSIPKEYHVGYIAGVFDLFHIGHLNLLRRAKEKCDYLIVGVVNDESVVQNKKTMPYIPFTERIEIVRACRYVDEAVEIPTEYNNTDEAYRRYHFDVQFSGSDYADDPVWLGKKAWLQKQGADMIFFPYTESTSSTKIKAAIRTKNPDMTGEESY